jgi:AAT family amino acid transporter/aromatic amino acid transport protein AroP
MGLLMSMAFIMFSFGGLELVGITAAEAAEPQSDPEGDQPSGVSHPDFLRGALTVLLSLYPWDQLLQTLGASGDAYSGSPFVQIFSLIGNDTAAHILNFVVLTAALSVYNSGVYCNSRMLFGLAEQGDAPKALMKLNKQGVPLRPWGFRRW